MTEDTHDKSATAAAARILAYLERRRKSRGIDHEEIHAFDASPSGGIYLRSSDLEAMATALTSAPGPSADGDNVLVPRAVIADLYRFLHNTWVGEGRVTDEGSHGKDLLDWRQTMSHYHRQPAATQGDADEDPAERS